jgi:hypothetical protein
MTDTPAAVTAAVPVPAPAQSTPPQPATPSAAKPVTPGSKAWAEMSPDQRAAQQRTVTDAGRTSASVHTRTADGRPLIDGRLADGTVPTTDPTAPPIDPATATTTDTGEKFKVGEFDVSEQEIRDLLSGKAERDLARTQIPAQPADYKVEVPATADLPEGAAVALKNDPATAAMIDAAQRWAHKNGLSQAAFNELVAIQAHGVIAEQQNYARLSAANLDALGSRGPQRIDALTTWIRGEVGDTDAKPIIATMATAAHVRFFEKMHQKITSQGASPFRQTGRDVEPRGVSEDAWNAMSYGEKKAYAERASSAGTRR